MNEFIEVTVKDSSFTNNPKEYIGETRVSGKILLETSNIQCISPSEKGCLVILKSRRTSDICDIASECDYNELMLEESYESLRAMLIKN
ncbi:MAG: hypothetical protein MJZ79_04030 [Paludibacteraceae bacterium]|nr:hypothetical protein [Paludibacteraceae bacterium]